ncbi:MAG: glycosyltransferase family 4 protein [Rickettsiales bacterium]
MKNRQVIFNLVQSNINGGLENMYLAYSKILAKDYEVICLVSKNFVHINELKQQNIKYEILNIKGHFDFFAVMKFVLLVKKYQPKLIFAHNGRCFALLNLYKFLVRKVSFKTVAVSHGGNPKRLVNFNYIITVAQHLKAKIIKKYPDINQEKIKVIYNGISLVKITNKTQINDKNKALTFGILSRLSVEKNIITAIKAFALFSKEVKNSKLVIAGEGPEEACLKNYVLKHNLERKVVFLGHQQNIKNFFKQIDVLVHPALEEPFGLVILEAYNYNTIVIGSNRGGLKEIIKHEYNGFLYDAPASFINLKEAMLAYHKLDDKYKRKIISNASKSLKNNFSVETLEKKLLLYVATLV